MILPLVLLINTVYADIVITKCPSGCQNINPMAGDCVPIMGGSTGSCDPIFDTGCRSGCIYNAKSECVNSDNVVPTITQKYPDHFQNIIYCPENCYNKNNTCIPLKNNTVCNQKIDWKCPNNCYYNATSDKCESNNPMTICQLIEKTLQCPYGCQYNINFDRCMCSNINIVCGKERGLICPTTCSLNPYGDKCIRINNPTYYPCEYTFPPICSSECQYLKEYNRCMPKTINDICEPLKIATCKEKYYFDSNIENCTIYNQNKPCLMSNNTLQYPANSINNEICKFKINADCTGQVIKSCGQGCNLNKTTNKCIPPDRSTMCGSGFLQNAILKLLRFNNTLCNTGLIPATIFGNPYCVSQWYFDV